jgi:hypothetical protein
MQLYRIIHIASSLIRKKQLAFRKKNNQFRVNGHRTRMKVILMERTIRVTWTHHQEPQSVSMKLLIMKVTGKATNLVTTNNRVKMIETSMEIIVLSRKSIPTHHTPKDKRLQEDKYSSNN